MYLFTINHNKDTCGLTNKKKKNVYYLSKSSLSIGKPPPPPPRPLYAFHFYWPQLKKLNCNLLSLRLKKGLLQFKSQT